MAVREFDGIDDQVILDDGAIGALANGAHSVALIVKPTTTGGGDRFFWAARAGGSTLMGVYRNGGNLFVGTDFADSGANVGMDTTWQICGISKAAGTVAPRMHRKQLGVGSWSHVNAASAVANVATDILSFAAGSIGGGLYSDGRLAVIGLFSTELSDADWVSMQTTPASQTLASLGAVALWEFRQSSAATPVLDLIGSAHETALTGTTVVTGDDPPGWAFGLGAAATSSLRRRPFPRALLTR